MVLEVGRTEFEGMEERVRIKANKPLKFPLLRIQLLPSCQHPCPVNSPVSQRAHAAQLQGSRCQRVLHVVSYECNSGVQELLLVGALGHWGSGGEWSRILGDGSENRGSGIGRAKGQGAE
jgi:hypothetical protein